MQQPRRATTKLCATLIGLEYLFETGIGLIARAGSSEVKSAALSGGMVF